MTIRTAAILAGSAVVLLSGGTNAAFAPPPTGSRIRPLLFPIAAGSQAGRCLYLPAKKRSLADETAQEQELVTMSTATTTTTTTTTVSPTRPDTSLPVRRRNRKAASRKNARGGPPHSAHSPSDLLSDLPYLDKHQFVDKLVERHLFDSASASASASAASAASTSQEPLPRPLSVTQASTSFMPALVLNADYQPLSFTPLSLWSWQEAIKAVFRGKVTVVDVYDNVKIRGVSVEVPLPSVIALNEYVSNHKSEPAFTKRNVFLRDEYKCQYCNGQFFAQNDLSIDHVHPRCKGGRLHWENAVTSCRICNGKKGCLGVAELGSVGMRLLRPPKVPSQYELSRVASRLWLPRRKVHPAWRPYLEQYFEQQ